MRTPLPLPQCVLRPRHSSLWWEYRPLEADTQTCWQFPNGETVLASVSAKLRKATLDYNGHYTKSCLLFVVCPCACDGPSWLIWDLHENITSWTFSRVRGESRSQRFCPPDPSLEFKNWEEIASENTSRSFYLKSSTTVSAWVGGGWPASYSASPENLLSPGICQASLKGQPFHSQDLFTYGLPPSLNSSLRRTGMM